MYENHMILIVDFKINRCFLFGIIFVLGFTMTYSFDFVFAEHSEQVMNDNEINSVRNCEIGIYEGSFSNGKYYLNLIQKNEDSCNLDGFSKTNDIRKSFDCQLPFDYLITFDGWNDNAMWPEFPKLVPFADNCQVSEKDESLFSNYYFFNMSDEELINLFQEILNIKTKEEFLTKFPTDVEIEHIGVKWTTTLLRIEDKLNQRGWELSSYAAIHENGSMVPFLNILEPKEFHRKVFRSIDMELFSVDVKELVNEYNALLDKLGSHPEQLDISQELINDINSDLYKFENIVVVLQYRGYDGMTDVEFIDGLPFGSISYFDKYSLEPLFKRQIPQGAINIFGTMGLFKELDSEGIPLSYEEQVILLNSSSALIGTISSFNHSTDPDNEIALTMILSAIGAYHPSVDNLSISESELLSSEETPSLKIQEKSGVAPLDIICREGLQKIFKSSDYSPTCVMPATAEKLTQRGWAIVFIPTVLNDIRDAEKITSSNENIDLNFTQETSEIKNNPFKVLQSPIDIAVNSNLNTLYVLHWRGEGACDCVSVINGSTYEKITEISMPGDQKSISINENSNMIYVLTGDPLDSTYDPNERKKTIHVIDGLTNKVVETIGSGFYPSGSKINPVTDILYVTNFVHVPLLAIDTSTNKEITTIPMESKPFRIAINSITNVIYVIETNDKLVNIIDGITNKIIKKIKLENDPSGITIDPITNRVFVLSYDRSDPLRPQNIPVINGTTNTILKNINFNTFGNDNLMFNENNNKIYLTNSSGNNVLVIDSENYSISDSIDVDGMPRAIAMDYDRNLIYVISGINSIFVIDGNTQELLR